MQFGAGNWCLDCEAQIGNCWITLIHDKLHRGCWIQENKKMEIEECHTFKYSRGVILSSNWAIINTMFLDWEFLCACGLRTGVWTLTGPRFGLHNVKEFFQNESTILKWHDSFNLMTAFKGIWAKLLWKIQNLKSCWSPVLFVSLKVRSVVFGLQWQVQFAHQLWPWKVWLSIFSKQGGAQAAACPNEGILRNYGSCVVELPTERSSFESFLLLLHFPWRRIADWS